MHVGVHQGPSLHQDMEDFEPRGEQRLVPRVLDPFGDFQNEDNREQEDSGNYQGPNFLQWNPNNRMMMLQIRDYIGSRPADEDTPNDEENWKTNEDDEGDDEEEAEDTRPKKKHRRQGPQQGNFDFEDFRRMPEPRRTRPKKKKSNKFPAINERKPKRTRDEDEPQEDEEDDGDVYGTDPVVHYLKDRRGKGRTRDFGGFGGDGDDDTGEFTMREWWNY
ncbi:hypothetical protein JTE90_013767 [Oedothorax gibbosus]|uniref:Uncharacterized protein n=1 Tax=Oedothorax gibbosus TaxID=931172 RepID=A0AAV6UYJ0_9ARAC|nr:hypothetical protein JTE90_013767 [Oedothorax gibbosus]